MSAINFYDYISNQIARLAVKDACVLNNLRYCNDKIILRLQYS